MQTAYPPSLTLPRGWLAGRRRYISDDEQFFSRAHEAQFTAGNLFNGGGVFAQTPRFLSQGGILRAQSCEVGPEPIVLFASPYACNKALIADQRIDGEDANDEEEQAGENFAATVQSCARLRVERTLRAMSCLNFDNVADGHKGPMERVLHFRLKYKQ
jgi:hypothetical protein